MASLQGPRDRGTSQGCTLIPLHFSNAPYTYQDALDVLNARRAGADMPVDYVMRALELTGDYDPVEAKQKKEGFRRLIFVDD